MAPPRCAALISISRTWLSLVLQALRYIFPRPLQLGSSIATMAVCLLFPKKSFAITLVMYCDERKREKSS